MSNGIPTQVDEAKLEALVGTTVGELAAAVSGVLALLGDRLGLYSAMAGAGPLTASALAERTGTAERYVREWLHNQAAGGIVDYDPASATFVCEWLVRCRIGGWRVRVVRRPSWC